MWKVTPALVALSLGGCVSVPADYAMGAQDTAELTRLASVSVETLVLSIGTGGMPDFGSTQMAIERARLAVVSRIAMGIGHLGLEQYAGLGALGTTLSFCQDGVARLHALYVNDPDAAMVQARTRFWPGCAMPLGLIAIQGQTAATVAWQAPSATQGV